MIVLDLVFVAKLEMGVNGVALATVIAQAISALLCMLRLMKMQELFEIKPCYLKLQKKYTRKIIRLGLPSGITQAIFSMAMIVVQSLTNSFGEMFIAANVIVMRVDGFAMMPNFSFGTAMTTYAGQNVGARMYDRVEKGAKQGTFIAMGVSAILTSLILIFGKALMGIFTKTPELVDLSRDMMGILAVGYIAMAVTQSLSGVMRGAGDTVDAHVDFHCDDDPDPRAHCLRHFFLYKNGAAAERKAGMHLYLAAGFLADRSADHVCLLPERKVEGEGDLRTKRVRTVNLQAEDGAAAWNTTTV